MRDLISRQEAINELVRWGKVPGYSRGERNIIACTISMLETLPSAQPDPEIRPVTHLDCQKALLKMWMDNVITDGEHRRIFDRLNAKEIREGREDG